MRKVNRKTFFNYVRRAPFGGKLTTAQVEGMGKILDEWERRKMTDGRWLAYMLATTFHETASTMQPIRERGGETYLKGKKYYPWVGEGLVQVTWEENHRKFGATKPGQMMTWPIAIKALFDGMIRGMFTGKELSDYFNETKDDPVGARRIVNGTDKAKLIAGYYRNFLDALTAAGDALPPADVTVADAQPDDKPPEKSTTAVTTVGGLFGGAGLTALLGVDNPWAFGVAALLIVLGALAGYMFFSGRWQVLRSKAV